MFSLLFAANAVAAPLARQCGAFGIVTYDPVPVLVVPSVSGDPDATVTGDATNGFVVKPSLTSGAVEVVIPDGIDAAKVTVKVAPGVTSVRPNGATVKVVNGANDITAFLDIPAAVDGVIDMSAAKVKETIVKEALDVEKGAVVELNAAAPAITTAPTRAGLKYTFSEGTTIEGMTQKAQKTGDGNAWTPNVTIKGGISGFYSIGVGK